jgi:hypothetical protein
MLINGLFDYDPERDGDEEAWAASLAEQGVADVGAGSWPVDQARGASAAALESAPRAA